MAETDARDSHLSCSICFTPFDGQQRRPWDIGCGHSYCEHCLGQHPRSFRYCPECRARASSPHVNIALLRLVDDAQHATTGEYQQQQQRSQQQQQQQQLLRQALTHPRGSSSSREAAPAAESSPLSLILHRPHDVMLRAQVQNPGSAAALPALNPTSDLQTSLAAHQAKIAEWRTRMWVYLAPVLGFLYLISPLDIIPDFLPLIGWLDDFLVIMYIACSIFSAMGQQQQQQRNTMRL